MVHIFSIWNINFSALRGSNHHNTLSYYFLPLVSYLRIFLLEIITFLPYPHDRLHIIIYFILEQTIIICCKMFAKELKYNFRGIIAANYMYIIGYLTYSNFKAYKNAVSTYCLCYKVSIHTVIFNYHTIKTCCSFSTNF